MDTNTTNYNGMTEQELIEIGFERVDEFEENYHYYIMDISDDITLISNASDEAERDGWNVELFDSASVKFKTKQELLSLITILINNLDSDE